MKQTEIIGYFFEGDFLVVANPCKIPLEILEESIKNHKISKDKNKVTKIGVILIPIKIPKELQKKLRKKTK